MLLSIACAPFMPCFAAAPATTESLDRVVGLLEHENTDGASAALESTVSATPQALWLVAKGCVLLKQGNALKAEQVFRDALAINSKQVAALWGLTICLLQRGQAHEAATQIDRAADINTTDTRIKMLQAYVWLQLGQLTDAARYGKLALDSGERSPFLMATLAQIHYGLAYPQKAIEFGSFAAKCLDGIDFSTPATALVLPLSLVVKDQELLDTHEISPNATHTTQLSLPEMKLPAETTLIERPLFEVLSPKPGSDVTGIQDITAIYRGHRAIAYVVLLVDGELRGVVTDLPYVFRWNADACSMGEHHLTVRAYDARRQVIDESTFPVTSIAGKRITTLEMDTETTALNERMIKLMMPNPTPLTLFENLGKWYLETHEIPQAIAALENAVAIDSLNPVTLQQLMTLYQANGLHTISSTGEISVGPSTGRHRVALTFDDGPNPLYTPLILVELARFNAQATFFLVGKMVEKNPSLTLQILASGHELANHTYNHPNLVKLTPQEIVREMLLARTVIRGITGRDTYLFRPPGGNIDPDVTRELRALDYNVIYWNINAGDYKRMLPQDQAMRIVNRVQDGSIILLHNGPVDGTLGILPTILAELQKRGYSFVTVTDLLTK